MRCYSVLTTLVKHLLLISDRLGGTTTATFLILTIYPVAILLVVNCQILIWFWFLTMKKVLNSLPILFTLLAFIGGYCISRGVSKVGGSLVVVYNKKNHRLTHILP